MRILLTGSSGWLGRFLARRLRADGHDVFGLDWVAGPDTDLVASISDHQTVMAVCTGNAFDAVVHSAALHKPDIARLPAQGFIDVNVTGTLNLLDAAAANGVSRFIFTSTTSLMVSQAVRDEAGDAAIWLDEHSGPLAPRNVYGITKLAAEGLCRDAWLRHRLPCLVLRTSRFFPEDDDTLDQLSGANLKANELLHRRLTVEDAVEAHMLALQHAPRIGFDTMVVSAPTPFAHTDCAALKRDAVSVICRLFPDAAALYAQQGWHLPSTIGRVYDASYAQQRIGFRAKTDFAAVLQALRQGGAMPFAHDPSYVSPSAVKANPA